MLELDSRPSLGRGSSSHPLLYNRGIQSRFFFANFERNLPFFWAWARFTIEFYAKFEPMPSQTANFTKYYTAAFSCDIIFKS